MTLRRLQTALAVYAALAVAGYFLASGDLRIQGLLWFILAAFALKTWAAYKLQQLPPNSPPPDSKHPEHR